MKFLKISAIVLMSALAFGACKSSKKMSSSQTTANSLFKKLKAELSTADVAIMGDTVRVIYPEISMFDFGKSVLKTEALPNFQRFALVMRDYPTINFMINGYTDNVGTDAVNMQLSQQRSDASKKILGDYGVDAGRMSTAGLGAENPIMSNGTDQGRMANRRVEFLLFTP